MVDSAEDQKIHRPMAPKEVREGAAGGVEWVRLFPGFCYSLTDCLTGTQEADPIHRQPGSEHQGRAIQRCAEP